MTMTTARTRKGSDTGVSWEWAVEQAHATKEKFPEVLRDQIEAVIRVTEEKFPEDPTPDEVDAAVSELQSALPYELEEILDCAGPNDPGWRVANCIQTLASEVLELRARVATLEGGERS